MKIENIEMILLLLCGYLRCLLGEDTLNFQIRLRNQNKPVLIVGMEKLLIVEIKYCSGE